MHCGRCIEEGVPQDMSPREWARLEVGFTPDGTIQVWCVRHDTEVAEVAPHSREGKVTALVAAARGMRNHWPPHWDDLMVKNMTQDEYESERSDYFDAEEALEEALRGMEETT